MRPLDIILGLILAFHVSAQGGYPGSIQYEPTYYTTTYDFSSVNPLLSFLTSKFNSRTTSKDCQTPDTNTATSQPTSQSTSQLTSQSTSQSTSQPTEQPTEQPTVQPTAQTSVSQTTQQTVQEPTSTSTSTSTPSPTPSAPTQSCHAIDNYWWISYTVFIGIPYGGEKDCDATYNALESATWSISLWKCVEKNGDIQLSFNAFPYEGSLINGALESRYPTVAGGFNCPDH
jgi:hypothetical protein